MICICGAGNKGRRPLGPKWCSGLRNIAWSAQSNPSTHVWLDTKYVPLKKWNTKIIKNKYKMGAKKENIPPQKKKGGGWQQTMVSSSTFYPSNGQCRLIPKITAVDFRFFSYLDSCGFHAMASTAITLLRLLPHRQDSAHRHGRVVDQPT